MKKEAVQEPAAEHVGAEKVSDVVAVVAEVAAERQFAEVLCPEVAENSRFGLGGQMLAVQVWRHFPEGQMAVPATRILRIDFLTTPFTHWGVVPVSIHPRR